MGRGRVRRWLFTLVLAVGLGVAAAHAAAPAHVMRVVGGLAGVNQYLRWEEPFWTQELPRLSGGRFGAEIVPFDRAGVPPDDMLRLVQLGVMPFGTVLLSSLTAYYPEYTAPDLAGLSNDMAAARVHEGAFRPFLTDSLAQQHGIRLLAMYVYPAQVVFCKKPFSALTELSGRRVRVSSAGQADFVEALGASAVQIPFAQIVRHIESGSVDCAITGTLSGNGLGLHLVTTHLHSLPISWGMAMFVANQRAWDGLPADLRSLLTRELPKLEAAIWAESERDTERGIACNTGQPSCKNGSQGRMTLVPASAQDQRLQQQVFSTSVLPRWLRRCGQRCADVWNQTIGTVRP